MSKYVVDSDHSGIDHKTLVADEIDEIIFENRPQAIEVVNEDGEDRINLTIDGSDPVVDGGEFKQIPGFPAVRTINIPAGKEPNETLVVKMISPGNPTYTISKTQRK